MRLRSAIGKRTSKFSGDAQKTEKKIRNENSVRMCGKLKSWRESRRERGREKWNEKIFFTFVVAATLLECWEVSVTGDWILWKFSQHFFMKNWKICKEFWNKNSESWKLKKKIGNKTKKWRKTRNFETPNHHWKFEISQLSNTSYRTREFSTENKWRHWMNFNEKHVELFLSSCKFIFHDLITFWFFLNVNLTFFTLKWRIFQERKTLFFTKKSLNRNIEMRYGHKPN